MSRKKIGGSDLEMIFPVDANYERWGSFIFPHSDSEVDISKRRISTAVTGTMPDGKQVKGSIEIIPGDGEMGFSSKTYEVLEALMMIFRDEGMPDTPISTSLNKICAKMEISANARYLLNARTQLFSMSRTTVSWKRSYQTKDSRDGTITDKRILDTFSYSTKEELKEEGRGEYENSVVFRLSEHIRENLRNNITIPVNFKQRRRIRSEFHKAVYSRFDNILLSNGTKVLENTAFTLVENFYLNAKNYRFKSRRQGLCERLAKALNGAETSQPGVFMNAVAVETADESDWKVRVSLRGTKNSQDKKLAEVNDEGLAEELALQIATVVGEAEANKKLYLRFGKVYSDTLVFRAIGEFKETSTSMERAEIKLENRGGLFSSIIHEIAHKSGEEWIKTCGKDCKLRPENRLL